MSGSSITEDEKGTQVKAWAAPATVCGEPYCLKATGSAA